MSRPFTLRPFCLGASLAACGPVGMFATSALVAHRGRGWIATDTAHLRGDVAIVLGANLRSDGTPGDMLKDRLAQGLRLYRLGRVPKIMISGFKPHSAVMHEWLLERGVPEEAIDADHRGNRTLLSMVNANERGYRAPVICTQAFHLPRALWLARQMGLRGIGFPADRRIYRTIRRVRRRERIAQLRAFIDVYGFQIAPTHPH